MVRKLYKAIRFRFNLIQITGKKIDSVYNELTRHFDKITAIYTGYSASWVCQN